MRTKAVRRKRVVLNGTSSFVLANADASDKAVIQHLREQPETVLVHNQKLLGTRKLHEHGLYVCDHCGHINTIDRHDCKKCQEPKFINLHNQH
jgi:hypothetical protein